MKLKICLLSLVILSIILKVYAKNNTDDILGVWLSQEKTSKIKIYKCGNEGKKYCGKIVWLKRDKESDGSARVDKNNPDPKKRLLPLLDMVILKSFEYDHKKDEWNNGKIYDPYTGYVYECYIKKSGHILSVRGYIGASFIGRTADWTKVE